MSSNGLDTKALFTEILEDSGTLVLTTTPFSTLPQTISYEKLTASHVVVDVVPTDPSVMIGKWNVKVMDGELLITGNISGETALTLKLSPSNSTGKSGVYVLETGAFSSLPKTVSDANITSNHVVVHSVLSNPQVQLTKWEPVISDGSIVISGGIDGTTDLTLYLSKEV